MNGNHEAALSEMENAHLVAMAILQEAHAKTLMGECAAGWGCRLCRSRQGLAVAAGLCGWQCPLCKTRQGLAVAAGGCWRGSFSHGWWFSPLAELKDAHEQQRKQLEQDFEKLRLSLQVGLFGGGGSIKASE